MSAETFKKIKRAKEDLNYIQRELEQVRKNVDGLDGNLTTKIKKAEEGVQEVTKHIEESSK